MVDPRGAHEWVAGTRERGAPQLVERDDEHVHGGERTAAPATTSGNGHAADEARIAMLRDRIDAARRRLRDEVDTIRGE